jgi:hypothetical protein
MKLPLVIATLGLAFATHTAHAEEPAALAEPAVVASPEVRYPPSSVRPKLILGGLVISGVAYAAAAVTAVNWPEEFRNDKGDVVPVTGSSRLMIPIVGPWMTLSLIGCTTQDSAGNPDCGAWPYVRGVLDGIVQLAGFGLIGEGIFMKTEAKSAPQKSLALGLPGGVTLYPVPMTTGRFTGLGFVGTF